MSYSVIPLGSWVLRVFQYYIEYNWKISRWRYQSAERVLYLTSEWQSAQASYRRKSDAETGPLIWALTIMHHCVNAHFSFPFPCSCKRSYETLSNSNPPSGALGCQLTSTLNIFPTFCFSFRVSTLDHWRWVPKCKRENSACYPGPHNFQTLLLKHKWSWV